MLFLFKRLLTTGLIAVTAALIVLGPVTSVVGTALTIAGGAAKLFSGGMMGAIGPILAVGAAIAGVIAAIHEFNRLTTEAAQSAGQQLAPSIQGGLTRQQIEDEFFKQAQAQFGDLGARLLMGSGVANVSGKIDELYKTGMGASLAPKAMGGPVDAGEAYLVGEQGPEILRMGSRSGSITPNHAMGGIRFEAGSIVIHANTYEGGQAAARGFKDELDELLNFTG